MYMKFIKFCVDKYKMFSCLYVPVHKYITRWEYKIQELLTQIYFSVEVKLKTQANISLEC